MKPLKIILTIMLCLLMVAQLQAQGTLQISNEQASYQFKGNRELVDGVWVTLSVNRPDLLERLFVFGRNSVQQQEVAHAIFSCKKVNAGFLLQYNDQDFTVQNGLVKIFLPINPQGGIPQRITLYGQHKNGVTTQKHEVMIKSDASFE